MIDKKLSEIFKNDVANLSSGESSLEIWNRNIMEKKVSELTDLDIFRMYRQKVYYKLSIYLMFKKINQDISYGEMWDFQAIDVLFKNNEFQKKEYHLRFIEVFSDLDVKIINILQKCENEFEKEIIMESVKRLREYRDEFFNYWYEGDTNTINVERHLTKSKNGVVNSM